MEPSHNTTDLTILLNDLVKINNDRVEGYRKAEQQAKGNTDLQSIFKEKTHQSLNFTAELKHYIRLLGHDYNSDTTFAGKVFRTWMDVKNTFKPNNTTSILDSCEFGEDAAIKAYDNALRSDTEISAEIRQHILEQQTAIKKSYDLIKRYRDLNLNLFKYNKGFTS